MCVVGFLFRFAFIIVSVLLSFIAFVDFLRLAFALVVFVRSLTIHNYTLYLAQTGAACAAAATATDAAGAAATNAADVVVIAVFACSEVKIAQF